MTGTLNNLEYSILTCRPGFDVDSMGDCSDNNIDACAVGHGDGNQCTECKTGFGV